MGKIRSVVTDRKGYMTVEASFIVPIILICIFIMILGFIYVYERAHILSGEYEMLYTIPLDYIRSKKVEDYLAGKDFNEGIVYGEVKVDSSYTGHKAKYKGTLSIKGDGKVNGSREIDVCIDRLRRWQLYGNTIKE